MPIYEYRCLDCRAKFATLVGMTAEADALACPKCGSANADRLVSRVGKFRVEDDRIDEIADRFERVGEPESPGEIRDLVREMGKAMDEDMADEMEAMFEADIEGTSDEEV